MRVRCIWDAREVHLEGPVKTAEKIKRILGDHQTYLTFDIDGLDPAFAPGTGTPVWGGLTTGQASIILRDLAGINMVGVMSSRCRRNMIPPVQPPLPGRMWRWNWPASGVGTGERAEA